MAVPSTSHPLFFEHNELHVLTNEGRLRHIGLDGATIFEGNHASARTFVEVDDGLIIETSSGALTAFTALEREAWSIPVPDVECPTSQMSVVDGLIIVLHSSFCPR